MEALKKIFKNRYRIVTDEYLGYEVQTKKWWFIGWYQCWNNGNMTNTFRRVEDAEDFVENRKTKGKTKVVKYL